MKHVKIFNAIQIKLIEKFNAVLDDDTKCGRFLFKLDKVFDDFDELYEKYLSSDYTEKSAAAPRARSPNKIPILLSDEDTKKLFKGVDVQTKQTQQAKKDCDKYEEKYGDDYGSYIIDEHFSPKEDISWVGLNRPGEFCEPKRTIPHRKTHEINTDEAGLSELDWYMLGENDIPITKVDRDLYNVPQTLRKVKKVTTPAPENDPIFMTYKPMTLKVEPSTSSVDKIRETPLNKILSMNLGRVMCQEEFIEKLRNHVVSERDIIVTIAAMEKTPELYNKITPEILKELKEVAILTTERLIDREFPGMAMYNETIALFYKEHRDVLDKRGHDWLYVCRVENGYEIKFSLAALTDDSMYEVIEIINKYLDHFIRTDSRIINESEKEDLRIDQAAYLAKKIREKLPINISFETRLKIPTVLVNALIEEFPEDSVNMYLSYLGLEKFGDHRKSINSIYLRVGGK